MDVFILLELGIEVPLPVEIFYPIRETLFCFTRTIVQSSEASTLGMRSGEFNDSRDPSVTGFGVGDKLACARDSLLR